MIASITDSERVLSPSIKVVLEVVRNTVNEQYPGLMPVLCPGELATTSKLFGFNEEMWLAFGGLSTNKTPTINSDKHFTLPTLAGLSFHSHASRLTQARSAAPQPSKGSSGSSRNPTVMNVAPSSSPDPFFSSAAEWPANSTAVDEVFQAAEYFATSDISLWSPPDHPEESLPGQQGPLSELP